MAHSIGEKNWHGIMRWLIPALARERGLDLEVEQAASAAASNGGSSREALPAESHGEAL